MFEKKVLESTVKNAVKKRLKELDTFHHWPVQMGFGDRCLDCHGCIGGHYFAIETKAPGQKPTAIQWHTIEAIRSHGGVVLIIDSEEKANAITAAHLKGE
jgi:hypothetical protein